MTDTMRLEDHRDDLPVFIHSELDDLHLTLEAFRVYAHLARRAGKNNCAWPSYNSIGEACFRTSYPKSPADTLRVKAIRAVNELCAAGLIEKKITRLDSGDHKTNTYRLTPKRQWKVGGSDSRSLPSDSPSLPPSDSRSLPSDGGIPKGYPCEVSPVKEDSPLEDTPRTTQPNSTTQPSAENPPMDESPTATTGLSWDELSDQDHTFTSWSTQLLTDPDVGLMPQTVKSVTEKMPPSQIIRFVGSWFQDNLYAKTTGSPIRPNLLAWRLKHPAKHTPGPLAAEFIDSPLYRRHYAAAWEAGGDDPPQWVEDLPIPPRVEYLEMAVGGYMRVTI